MHIIILQSVCLIVIPNFLIPVSLVKFVVLRKIIKSPKVPNHEFLGAQYLSLIYEKRLPVTQRPKIHVVTCGTLVLPEHSPDLMFLINQVHFQTAEQGMPSHDQQSRQMVTFSGDRRLKPIPSSRVISDKTLLSENSLLRDQVEKERFRRKVSAVALAHTSLISC